MQVNSIALTQNLQEITLQGSTHFPLSIYTIVVKEHIYGHIPLHWHDELQFILVTKGTVKFSVEKKEYVLEENQGLFINAGRLHCARSIKGDEGAFICCEFLPGLIAPEDSPMHCEYIDPVLANADFSAFQIEDSIQWQNHILKIIRSMDILMNSGDKFKNLKLKSMLYSIWYIFLSNLELSNLLSNDLAVGSISHSNDRVKILLEFIHRNFDKKISLDDLARASNMSRSGCCRLFKDITECTPFEYISKYRISRSMTLLKQDILSIAEISHKVGFNTPSYYISSFKSLVGMTPYQYRKKSQLPHGD